MKAPPASLIPMERKDTNIAPKLHNSKSAPAKIFPSAAAAASVSSITWLLMNLIRPLLMLPTRPPASIPAARAAERSGPPRKYPAAAPATPATMTHVTITANTPQVIPAVKKPATNNTATTTTTAMVSADNIRTAPIAAINPW